MREVKFRIWDNNHNEFIRPDYGLIGFCYPLDGRIAVLTSNGDPIEDCVIEQYTGLKDKNGKEIYEGDILGGIWESGFISWCEKCKQLQYHSADIGCMACSGDVYWYELAEDDGKLEVIGNVHENADLLEGK